MALETLTGVKKINGVDIVVMEDLAKEFPQHFNSESGAMDWQWFEKEIRPNKFIYVRNDKNSLTFNLQDGPVKESGVNGCQVTDIIAVAHRIIEKLNDNYPCEENIRTIKYLENALDWQLKRTQDREARGVEGESKQ